MILAQMESYFTNLDFPESFGGVPFQNATQIGGPGSVAFSVAS